jgi:hypothetical protein
MIHRLAHLVGSKTVYTSEEKGKWVRAVPEPFYGGLLDRLRDAYHIVTGKAYAVYWPKPGELEKALDS